MKNKLKFLIPAAVLLSIPWAHKLFYENLMLAWPNMGSGDAHALIIISSAIAVAATCIYTFG